jgi:hypothetical protein
MNLEDKYNKFYRNTDIDLEDEIGSGGPGGGVSDHGELDGLSDDDHTQYFNQARGDVRYYTKSQIDSSLENKASNADLNLLESRVDTLEGIDVPDSPDDIGAAFAVHDHNSSYYTKAQIDTSLGAKANKVSLRQAWITSGNIQLNTGTNTWGPLTGSPTLVIPAAVGDYLDLSVSALRQANANIFLDVGVVVSGNVVRYLGTGTSTPPGEGESGFYHTALPSKSGPRGFVVESGDISGGNVTLSWAIRNLSGASSLLLASTDNPMYWRVSNWGPVTTS